MKKIILIVLTGIVVLLFGSCKIDKYYTSSTSGQDDVAYVVVLSDNINGNVTIMLDGKNIGEQKIYPVKTQRKSEPVAISVGKHDIQVQKDGQILYEEKNMFIGLQETKKIILK